LQPALLQHLQDQNQNSVTRSVQFATRFFGIGVNEISGCKTTSLPPLRRTTAKTSREEHAPLLGPTHEVRTEEGAGYWEQHQETENI
jgi:hypothetical protein